MQIYCIFHLNLGTKDQNSVFHVTLLKSQIISLLSYPRQQIHDNLRALAFIVRSFQSLQSRFQSISDQRIRSSRISIWSFANSVFLHSIASRKIRKGFQNHSCFLSTHDDAKGTRLVYENWYAFRNFILLACSD